MEFHTVSWETLHNNAFQLAQKIQAGKKHLNLIVAIARGGMTVAQVLSDFLSLPVATFTVSSYRDMQQKELSDIAFHVGARLEHKHILLVDDISDTGKTFVRGVNYLKQLGAETITTASLFVKSQTKHLPNFYCEKIDKWIVFPYEIQETICSITKLMNKEGRTKTQIQTKLKEIGISSLFIDSLT